MKVLFLSNLFPDAAEPQRGVYNARLVQQLGQQCEIRVVSPRPTLPLGRRFTACARPQDEAFRPLFPPAWYVPKIGSRWNHRLMARCLRPPLRRLGKEFPFEIILGSWLYPDGCAAAQLAAELKVPCVLIAQGSDVHQYLQRPVRRTVIVQALQRVAAGIVRSRELGRLLAAAGAPADKLHVIYNGVDLAVFQPGDPLAARRELGLPQEGQLLLYIGNLLPVKNPLLLLAAFAELDRRRPGPPLHLVMVGDGPLRSQARQQAEAAGLGDRVFLPGSLEAPRVARHLQAADVLCVPSDNEGVPNVMLEAFASGRPVVATRVGGIPELLTEAYLGQLVPPGDAPALAAALAATLRQPSRSEEIHRYARQFSWERTAAQYLALLRQGINP